MEYIIRSRSGPGEAFNEVGVVNVQTTLLSPQDRHIEALRLYFEGAGGAVTHKEFLVGFATGSVRLWRLDSRPHFYEG